MENFLKYFLICAFITASVVAEDEQKDEKKKLYKMCVPQKYYEDCLKILKEPSQVGTLMECVAGRDRIDCLEKVNKREADVIAVDPEDMYVAYHINNENFQVVSEIRSQVEKDAEFRYEGVILIKKASEIRSLQDLKGLKSCHTGFGRNVGYKIPITKLKNHGVLKVPTDPELAPTERELRALSEFFSQACLVGNYSPSPAIDQVYKKRYSNLCAICEKPDQCNYPDKFSGYDGAIRCLAQGQGDVAFTKTSYIKKFFGLLGEKGEADNPQDYEYLCEDGSRRSITGPACSWAQRPWRGYISNSESVKGDGLHSLQDRIDSFYENGLKTKDTEAAKHLLIESDQTIYEKKESEKPKEYLERAGYKDVIERDGSTAQKIRLCVSNDLELEKCKTLREAAYSRDIRPEFECIKKDREERFQVVRDNEADAVILTGDEYKQGREYKLKPMLYESYGEDVYVALVDKDADKSSLTKSSLKFDKENRRALNAARFLNQKRSESKCNIESKSDALIEICSSRDLSKYENKEVLCQDFTTKPISEYKTCNFEATLPNAVFIREDMTNQEIRNLVHAFTSLSERFSPKGKLDDVFRLFGEFKTNSGKNVLFTDDALELSTELKTVNGIDENSIKELECKN